MKKIVATLALISLLALPAMVFAQEMPTEPTQCRMRNNLTTLTGITCPDPTEACTFDSTTYDCGACCVLDVVYSVSNWIFIFVIFVAFIFVILGAYNIMSAGGSPEKVQTGRSFIMYAIIGLFFALIARSLPDIAMSFLGIS